MKTPKILFLISILVVSVIVAFFVNDRIASQKKTIILEKEFTSNYSIENTYHLPAILEEVSGIVWLSNNTFACIQDEDGFIFIYDTKQNAIIENIKFAGTGDYEDLAINNNDVYVLRSDGLIFEILNYKSENRTISTFKTPFSEANNMESLTFDTLNNRLLIAPKDIDLGQKHIKCIYEIPIATKLMNTISIAKINLEANEFKEFQHKKTHKTLRPSAIAINPITQDIYVLDAKNPKLLRLNSKGELLKMYALNKSEFAQPEGITFDNEGNLYISNEAANNWANILEVHLK